MSDKPLPAYRRALGWFYEGVQLTIFGLLVLPLHFVGRVLRWIHPSAIARWVNTGPYYWAVQAKRRARGEPLWQRVDLDFMGIPPPEGSPEWLALMQGRSPTVLPAGAFDDVSRLMTRKDPSKDDFVTDDSDENEQTPKEPSMTIAILYGTLTAFAYYIGARAKITEWLWSRYPAWLDYWMVCPACVGFWYGLGCGFLGAYYDWSLFGLDPNHWLTVLIAGALGTVWTPIVAYAHTRAWTELSAGELQTAETPTHNNPNCRSL